MSVNLTDESLGELTKSFEAQVLRDTVRLNRERFCTIYRPPVRASLLASADFDLPDTTPVITWHERDALKGKEWPNGL
jgi:hypothetical protein